MDVVDTVPLAEEAADRCVGRQRELNRGMSAFASRRVATATRPWPLCLQLRQHHHIPSLGLRVCGVKRRWCGGEVKINIVGVQPAAGEGGLWLHRRVALLAPGAPSPQLSYRLAKFSIVDSSAGTRQPREMQIGPQKRLPSFPSFSADCICPRACA